MDIQQVKSMIRAVCTSAQGSRPLIEFQKDYRTIVGQPIPFKQLGYPTLEAMLKSISDVVQIKSSFGQLYIQEVPTADTMHITKLVSKQNKSKKSKVPQKSFSRPIPARPMRNIPSLFNITRTITQNVPSQSTAYKPLMPVEVPPRFQKVARNSSANITTQNNNLQRQESSSHHKYKKELEKFVKQNNLGTVSFKTMACNTKGQKSKKWYCSTVKVKSHQYSTYPEEITTRDDAENCVAKIALQELKSEVKSSVSRSYSNDNSELSFMSSVMQIVNQKSAGVFNIGIEKEYQNMHNESLPPNWLQLITENCQALTIQKIDDKRSILYPAPTKPQRKSSSPEFSTNGNSNNSSSSDNLQRQQSSSSSRSSSVKSIVGSISPPPLVLPSEDTFDIFITRIVDPLTVFVRLVDYSDKYEELANDMDVFYIDQGRVATSIDTNSVYAAKVDASWLRIGVLSSDSSPGLAKCLYLDYGEIDFIEPSKLYVLEDQFCTLPYQALQCRLHGVDFSVNDNNAYLHMIQMIHGRTFVAKIIERSDPITVILYDTSTDEDININEKLVAITSKVKVNPELPKVGGIKETYLCHVVSDGMIYVHIKNEFFNFMLEELENFSEEDEKINAPVVSMPDKNKRYLAKYEVDDKWYRAEVLDVNMPGARVKVRFIDYGNVDEVPVANLRDLGNLSLTLKTIPPQAIACKLHLLPPDGWDWTEAGVNKLNELAPEDQPLLLKVVSSSTEKSPAVVDLFKRIKPNNEIVSINTTLLVSVELFKESESKLTEEKLPNKKISASGDDNGETPISLPTIPNINEYIDVIVTNVASPFNFTCQPLQLIQSLKKIESDMQTLYGSLNADESKKVTPGMFAVIKHTEGGWRRIFIHDFVDRNPVTVSAYFIDYGEYGVLSQSKLFPLDQQFRNLPALAIKASLHGVAPLNGDWSPMDCIAFKDIVYGKALVAKIQVKHVENNFKIPIPHISVILIDTSIRNLDIYIATELINKRIAKAKS